MSEMCLNVIKLFLENIFKFWDLIFIKVKKLNIFIKYHWDVGLAWNT